MNQFTKPGRFRAEFSRQWAPMAGLSSANPARKIPYAARIPNAIDPIDARINIDKFNKSPIVSVPVKSFWAATCAFSYNLLSITA